MDKESDLKRSVEQSLQRKLLDNSNDPPTLLRDCLLERYLTGAVSSLERKMVEEEMLASPASAAELKELTAFADFLSDYDWSQLDRPAEPYSKPFHMDKARELLRQFGAAWEVLLEPLRIRPYVLDHSSDDDLKVPLRQSLLFQDDRALGSFTATEETFQLHIEHTEWLPGSLALLTIISQDDTPLLNRFLVFQRDWKRAAVDQEIPRFENDSISLALIQVDAARLPEDQLPALLEDCERALKFDPDAAEFWNLWAVGALANAPSGPLRETIEAIQAISTPS